MLKKQFLDDRLEEEGLWALTNEHTTELLSQISGSINFATQSKALLERKADIICKCYKKLESYDQMIKNLVDILLVAEGAPQENIRRKQFAMYNFEILAEYHLSQELIVQHSDKFLEIFTKTLQENEIEIKVASLKAISSFLSQIEDTDIVLKYKGMMNSLLDVVIAVMQ